MSSQTEKGGVPAPASRIDRDTHGQPETEEGSGRLWAWFLVVVLGAVAWWMWSPRLGAYGAGAWLAGGKIKAGQSPAPAVRPIPVVAARSKIGDLPIYLDELGTVVPFATVTIRSRVDGQIQRIAFTEGQYVKRGDLLVEIDPRPFQVQLSQAQGQMAKDQALLANALVDLGRYRDVPHTVTAQQLATQQALINQLRGTLRSDQAQIDNANLQLVYSRIEAPIDGRIGLRQVDLGNLVHANDPTGIAVITQLRPIAVVFNIPQDSIPVVMKTMRAGKELVVEAYDRTLANKLATGSLVAVDNQVDPGTGTLRLKAKFPNDDDVLFPNQFVNARLLVDIRKGSVIIPSAGVQRGPDSTFAYVVHANHAVEMRMITAGPSEGDQTVVEKGLKRGEIVVTDGADKLVAGMTVEEHVNGDSNDPTGDLRPGLRTSAVASPTGTEDGIPADPPASSEVGPKPAARSPEMRKRKKSE